MPNKNLLNKSLLTHWQTKDSTWVKDREQQWQRIESFIQQCTFGWFTKAELKRHKAYFLKGKVTLHEEDELSVDLALQLAWHPSSEAQVWQQQMNLMLSQFTSGDEINEIERCYQSLRRNIRHSDIYNPVTAAPSIFVGRERLLFEFFHCTPLLEPFEKHLKSNSWVEYFNGIYCGNLDEALPLPKLMAWGGFYTNGIYHQLLPNLSGFLTEEYFAKQLSYSDNKTRTHIVLRDPMVYAQRILNRELEVSVEDYARVELWREQIANASQSWQALWLEAEQDPVTLDEWREQQEAINPSPESEQKILPPWPQELAVLTARLAELGYPVAEDTPRDFPSILSSIPESKEVFFGVFSEAEYEESDLEEPYEYFASPLEELCNFASLNFKYVSKRKAVYFYADNKKVGKINLSDPEDSNTKNYYQSVVKLAERIFPEQVYCFGGDEFILYILPEKVVELLIELDYPSDLDYFCE
ncbi:hypothetical protein [Shewanella sp. TC10]|uniref:hypothetical protein n=1 Tax=Shewanella sp. TC10 TaxID=1419739 RepID=UPI00129E33B9|nr:hypothetical protein [Shewanella sp. TC10]